MLKRLIDLFRHPSRLVDLTPDQLMGALRSEAKPVLIDVRTAMEYKGGHIEGALSFPLGNEERIRRAFDKDCEIVLICKSGHRSQAAAAQLLAAGYDHISHLAGGMDRWRKMGSGLSVDVRRR